MDKKQLYLCNKVAAQLVGLEYIIDKLGSQRWTKNGLLHRDDDFPAVIHNSGYMSWWKNGRLHRDIGPAVIHNNGDEFYYLNDEKKTKDEVVAVWFKASMM